MRLQTAHEKGIAIIIHVNQSDDIQNYAKAARKRRSKRASVMLAEHDQASLTGKISEWNRASRSLFFEPSSPKRDQ